MILGEHNNVTMKWNGKVLTTGWNYQYSNVDQCTGEGNCGFESLTVGQQIGFAINHICDFSQASKEPRIWHWHDYFASHLSNAEAWAQAVPGAPVKP